MAKKSLRIKLITSFLLISTLPILLVGYLSYQDQKKALLKQLEENLYIVNVNLAKQFELFTKERTADLELLIQNPLLQTNRYKEIYNYIRAFENTYKRYDGTLLVTPDGTVKVDTYLGITGQNLSQRPWFKEASHGNTYFSDVYYSNLSNGPLLLLSAPIKDKSQKIKAIISPSVDLKVLWNLVDDFSKQRKEVGLSGYAFILNQKGDILAYPDRSKILNTNYFKANNLAKESVDATTENSKILYSKNSGDAVSFLKIKPSKNNDIYWYVGVTVPKSELLMPLNKLIYKYAFILGLVILITTLSSYYLTFSIFRPLHRLVRAAKDLGQGKKSPPIPIKTYDEIGYLTETFNNMVDKLNEREKEIIRGEKLRTAGELAAGVAHEIRNPLTTIKGFIQLINNDMKTNSNYKDYYELIIQEINRINQITTDFLTLTKPEMETTLKEADVAQVIEEILMLETLQAKAKNISINCNFQPIPLITVNTKHLKQVIINLIRNAMESMPHGGILNLETKISNENFISITIQDTGSGIPPSIIAKLGTPFLTTKEDGTGIGLMLCYQLVESMHGTLLVESTEGQGSIFTINLPNKFPTEIP